MVAPGRGILAADESNSTMAKRLEGVGVESTEESRRRFRELLFTTPEVERHISAVILYDETLRQADSDGTPFPALLAGRGMIPGIKVDTGAKPLAGRTVRR
jgi:fructose-bisphosphate aldolase, class I